jgi:uncharacterized membrane protein
MMAIQILVLLILPFLLTFVVEKNKVLRFIGPILLAYISGIILSNLPLGFWDQGLAMTVSEVTVLIAIPLVLMCTDLIKWLKLAKSTVVSFLLVMVSAVIAALLSGYLFRGVGEEYWKIAGMLTGCYTGGTPNLMAVGMALEINSEMLVLINTCDMFWGGLYFILITSFMKKVYKRFLPAFVKDESEVKEYDPFMEKVFSKGIKNGVTNIAITVGLSLLATGLAIGLSLLITGELSTVLIFLLVSTFGIALSFWKRLHRIQGAWNIGQYFILLFSIALGGTIDIKAFFEAEPTILLYTGCVMFSAIVIHFIFCKIFKIDADTAIITSTAGVYGPAFIAPVANAIGNRDVVVSGLISGLAGYAVGNYLGIGISYLVKMLG